VALAQRLGNRAMAVAVQRHQQVPDQTGPAEEAAATIQESDSTSQPIEASGGGAAPPAPGQAAVEQVPAATEEEKKDATAAGTSYKTDLAAAKKGGKTGLAMTLAGAEKILKGAYSDVKSIVPGKVEVLADRQACWDKYDEVCMADKLTNPDTGKEWAKGDAKKRSPGLDGFAWKGVVYVSGETTLVTATAHEMLHNNTAAGFRSAVGEAVNEGTTEMLAIKALKAAGVTGPSAYPKQVEIVNAIAAFVGEDKLTKAYFSGVGTLTAAYDAARGEAGGWPAVKAAADTLKLADVNALLKKKT
jgi:hypothetical protein